jgi:Ni/Fe-hydrogenase subunit HybB-like protein
LLADLGRPDRALHVLLRPNFASPLVWDVGCIGLYFSASLLYLYLPLVPDIALLRDRGLGFPRLYRLLAFGWSGTAQQKRRLNRAISVMAVLVIPLAVSVHTVVSWVFAMTVQPMWHSTIFGPYFVVGAIYSGIAAIVLVMALVRHFHHLHDHLKPIHFRHLGTLLLVFSLLWLYFVFAEHLTAYYGQSPDDLRVLHARLVGRYAVLFWTMVATCLVIPVVALARPSKRTVARTVIAAISVVVGMWLERLAIVVPTMVNPRVAIDGATYWPTWVEVAISIGSLSCFVFLYLLFTKFFPIVSIWEVREGREKVLAEVTERHRSYWPPSPEPEHQSLVEIGDLRMPALPDFTDQYQSDSPPSSDTDDEPS